MNGSRRVNLVREGFEAWNSEDPQWILEHMSPEVEWIAPERDPCNDVTVAEGRRPR